MKTYLIGYDLNKSGQNYTDLIDKIKELADNNGWWHQLDSTFIIKTNFSAEYIRDMLLPFIDKNDELLVIRVMEEAAWYGFGQAGNDWFKNHLTTE